MTDKATFSGTKLLLMQGDTLLTCLRDDFAHIPFPAHWDLPGGGREGDETPMECGLRELHEEFGLRLTAERLSAHRFATHSQPDRCAWLLAGNISATEVAAIRFGDEGQEWRMMPLIEFLGHPRAIPQFKERIRAVLKSLATLTG